VRERRLHVDAQTEIKRSKTLATCGKSSTPQKLPPQGWLVALLTAAPGWNSEDE
jgi:hypothetical protein